MNGRNFWASDFRAGTIAMVLCFLSWQCQAAESKDQQQLASGGSSFAFNLLRQISLEQPGSNIFISPYSASTALQMVCTGAAGTTRTQMQEVLGTIEMQPTALNLVNKEIGAIVNAKNTNFLLTTANAIWYRTRTPIYPSFLLDNEMFFGAKVESLDFNNPDSLDIINEWASQETHGKIDQIVSPPIDPTTRLFLANAVYFLGNWQTPFDTNLTTNRVFNLNGGGQETVPMMEQTGFFGYSQGTNYQAVRLDYKGGDLAMYVFLPGPDSSVEELLGTMNGAWWQQVIQSGFSEQQGAVVLPRFNLNFSVDLEPTLQALGMTDAFTQSADFSKISPEPLLITAATQQAVVEVNETGTEAAAVTIVTVGTTVAVPKAFEMVVDRPFLFFIEDQQAGMILFTGMVLEP
jgi:serine protease inhibitor